jgi:polyisoprenoid-binding protein YceI
MSTVLTPAATAWRVDPFHSNVEFSVRHLMIATVRGRFGELAGTLTGDDDHPETAAIEITIPAASIDTRVPQRDAHLRSADFFDAAAHPEIRFRSTRIARAGHDATLVVDGDLTIRGLTRPITLKVDRGGRVTDPFGSHRLAYSTTVTINRRDFGLNWNQVLETGGVLVGDDVTVSIDLELVSEAS